MNKSKRMQDEKFIAINQHLKSSLRIPNFCPPQKFIDETFLYLQTRLKNEMLYEVGLQYFVNGYLLLCLSEDCKVDNLYGLYYKILALPTQIQDDTQKEWQGFYKPVKTYNQQIRQRKCIYLLKMILAKIKSQIVDSKNKLWLLLIKAGQKQFNQVAIPVLTAFYFFSTYKSIFYSQTFELDPMHECLDLLYAKNRIFWASICAKFIAQPYQNQNYLDAFIIACLNLMSFTSKNYILHDTIIAAHVIRNRFISEGVYNVTNQINLDKLINLDKDLSKIGIQKASFILYVRLAVKSLENSSDFIIVIQKINEYCEKIPNGFPMIVNNMIMYCFNKSHLILKIDYDTNYEILIEKFKNDTKVILFLFLFYKNQKGFISQIQSQIHGTSLKAFVEDVIDLGLEQYLQNSQSSLILSIIIQSYNKSKHKNIERLILKQIQCICLKSQITNKAKEIENTINMISKDSISNKGISDRLSVIKVSESLLELYLKKEMKLELILKVINTLFKTEENMILFLERLFIMMKNIEPITINKPENKQFSLISECLLDKLNISIKSQRDQNLIVNQHSYIQRSVDLLEKLSQHHESMKKVLKFFLDRPSQTFIQSEIIKNRFLLKLALLSKFINITKNIYEIAHHSQKNQKLLQIIFPQINNYEARKVYLKYLVTKNLAQFRIQSEPFQQYKKLMSQQ